MPRISQEGWGLSYRLDVEPLVGMDRPRRGRLAGARTGCDVRPLVSRGT